MFPNKLNLTFSNTLFSQYTDLVHDFINIYFNDIYKCTFKENYVDAI